MHLVKEIKIRSQNQTVQNCVWTQKCIYFSLGITLNIGELSVFINSIDIKKILNANYSEVHLLLFFKYFCITYTTYLIHIFYKPFIGMFLSGWIKLHKDFRFLKGSLTVILVKISSMNSNVKIIFRNFIRNLFLERIIFSIFSAK